MIKHDQVSDADLHYKIRSGKIYFAGNRALKIYGTLYCPSGKRMTRINRVFFLSKEEAIANGYRPCGHCMKNEYKIWKNGSVQ